MATPAQDWRAEVWAQRHSGLEAGRVTQLLTPTQCTQASRDCKFAGTLSGDYLVCDPAAKPRIVTDNATACVDGTFVRPGGTHHCTVLCPPTLGVWVVSNPR
jgi:hypothetical protein